MGWVSTRRLGDTLKYKYLMPDVPQVAVLCSRPPQQRTGQRFPCKGRHRVLWWHVTSGLWCLGSAVGIASVCFSLQQCFGFSHLLLPLVSS